MNILNKKLYFFILFFYVFTSSVSYNLYAYTSQSSNVWVIDSSNGHGNIVADIINQGSPDANVVREFITNSDMVSSYKVAEAIYKAVKNKADIINLSLGASELSSTLYDAIIYAREHGVIVVAAAGNDGSVNYPAALDEVISVGACNASYSSEGDTCASDTVYSNGQYYIGTSFAAPRITAEIANRMITSGDSADIAAEYVTGSKIPTGGSTPELVNNDVLVELLRLIYFALLGNKPYTKTLIEIYKYNYDKKYKSKISKNYNEHDYPPNNPHNDDDENYSGSVSPRDPTESRNSHRH